MASAASLTAAEMQQSKHGRSRIVTYFSYQGNEYCIATNTTETTVSSHDAIVELVGVVDLTATNSGGIVTLHI